MSSIFDTAAMITTPISLVAFLAAVMMVAHARAVGRAERLIKTAPEEDRKVLVGGALQILDLRTKDLTREQRFELAVQTLSHRRSWSYMVFILCLVVALVFAFLAYSSFHEVDLAKHVQELLSEDNRAVALGLLKKKGIFDATDKDIVNYFVEKTSTAEGPVVRDQGLQIAEQAKKYELFPSLKELRQRAKDHASPFKPLGEVVQATVPDAHDFPFQFVVHVDRESVYRYRTLRLTDLETNKSLRVYARPAMEETPQTAMHISAEQAAFLNNGPLLSQNLQLVITETEDDIFDPNCSWKERKTPALKRIAKDLCDNGETVSVLRIQTVLAQAQELAAASGRSVKN